MAYASWSVVFGEQPSAAKWNILGTNDSYFDSLIGSGTAWGAFTPTIGANSGTITTSSATGKYTQLGKTIFGEVQITITTNGTGAGSITFSLPVTAKDSATTFFGAGRENASTGNMLQLRVRSATTCDIYAYNGTYPAANGYVLVCFFMYEAA